MATLLYVWGSGGSGQLGLGDTADYALPQRFSSASELVLSSVAYGGCHSAGLSTDGELFVWGDNEKQQLGLADAQQCTTRPESVRLARFGSNVALAACGWSHTVAIARERTQSEGGGEAQQLSDDDGDRVFTWGAHSHHQLGRPADSPSSPVAIPRFHAGILRVTSVACGWKHSLLSTESGDVFSWGTGRSGELGLGDTVLVAEHPTLVRAFVSASDSDSVRKIRQVLCGWQHSVFHAVSGEVFTCGSNRHGQLGTPEASAKVNGVPRLVKSAGDGGDEGACDLLASHVAVGWHFVLCLTASSPTELVSWGKGSHGQLGLGHLKSVSVATPVPFHPAAGVRAIACGSEHLLVVTNDGELFSCGWGEHGNLGHGNRETCCALEPVSFFSASNLEVLSVAAGGAVSAAIVRAR